MHELSLAIEIADLLEAHGRELTRITRFTLDIGTLSCVDESALRTALSSALKGSLAEHAEVLVERIEARARCLACGSDFHPPDRIQPCPNCGSPRKQWLAGQDFRLRSIEGC